MKAPYGAMRTTVPGTTAPISALILATDAPLFSRPPRSTASLTGNTQCEAHNETVGRNWRRAGVDRLSVHPRDGLAERQQRHMLRHDPKDAAVLAGLVARSGQPVPKPRVPGWFGRRFGRGCRLGGWRGAGDLPLLLARPDHVQVLLGELFQVGGILQACPLGGELRVGGVQGGLLGLELPDPRLLG